MRNDKTTFCENIYYLASFQRQDESEIPPNSQAAKTKIEYIVDVLSELGYFVEIFSIALVSGQKTQKSKCGKISEHVFVRYITSFGKKNKLITAINIIFMHIQTLYFLLRIPDRSTVIVYHSLNYMMEVALSKLIKKHVIILEMEEIYADVIGKKTRNREITFAQKVDAFIFPTRKLENLVNKKKRPFTILHGVYKSKNRYEKIFKDSKTHIVYAGTLDPRKGVITAIQSSLFLDEEYVIHILGDGRKEDVDLMKRQINENNNKKVASVIYEGVYEGEKFDQFIQSCDIGLCTQKVDALFTDTSFPSKVLMYLCNSLRVVCVPIETVRESNVSDLVTFASGDEPRVIAEAIIKCRNECEQNAEIVLSKLNDRFTHELNKLLKAVVSRNDMCG